MLPAPARVDAVMLEARATHLFRRQRPGPPEASHVELDAGDASATPAFVRGACARALGLAGGAPSAAVIVRPRLVSVAARELAGSGVRVAAELDGTCDAAAALADGAGEIEFPLDAATLLGGRPADAYERVAALKRACGSVPLKILIDARGLGSYVAVRRAADVALAAGADFLKTACATSAHRLPALVLLLSEALRAHGRRAGRSAGIAVAGRPAIASFAAGYREIVRETLGPEHAGPERFRVVAFA